SGEQALAAAADTAFTYATIDLQLQQDSGLQWIAPLRQQLPQARLLVQAQRLKPPERPRLPTPTRPNLA
ncbi:MAG: hypothetical protein ORN25_10215, partial [Caulobacteraceae bacterium]|nr:hypothetical protein [Caulobacteraceae bacterium]